MNGDNSKGQTPIHASLVISNFAAKHTHTHTHTRARALVLATQMSKMDGRAMTRVWVKSIQNSYPGTMKMVNLPQGGGGGGAENLQNVWLVCLTDQESTSTHHHPQLALVNVP